MGPGRSSAAGPSHCTLFPMTAVTFPPYGVNWFTQQADPDQFNTTAEVIMATAVAAFQQFGAADPQLGERIVYTRQLIGHTKPPILPAGDDGAGYQIVLGIDDVELGEAGAVQFRFPQGSPGKFGYEFVVYSLSISHPWPMSAGTERLGTDQDIVDKWRRPLWWNGRLMWMAMKALALGGISPPAGPLPVPSDQLHVGPLTPVGPRGGCAGWDIQIAVQLQ